MSPFRCTLSKSDDIWVSEGPCQGAANKGDDDVFSSCYCRMMVEWGRRAFPLESLLFIIHVYKLIADKIRFRSCYETVCPQSVMAGYSSSASKNECSVSQWATIAAEAGNGGGGGGGSGAAPTVSAGGNSGGGAWWWGRWEQAEYGAGLVGGNCSSYFLVGNFPPPRGPEIRSGRGVDRWMEARYGYLVVPSLSQFPES
jgi:hypothetical protein